MKTKKILAMLVALTMVLAVVPGLGIVASADETAVLSDELVLTLAKAETPVFNSVDPKPNDAADTSLAKAWNGWSDDSNGNNIVNVAGGVDNPRIQAYSGAGGSENGAQHVLTVTTPEYGAENDYVVLSFITEYTANWGDVALADTTGKVITAFRFGKGGNAFNVSWGHSGWGTPYSGEFPEGSYTMETNDSVTVSHNNSQIDILLRNISAEQYTATYFLNGTKFNKVTYAGNIKGLGSIKMNRGSGNQWERIALLKPVIYAGNYPTESNEVTVQEALDSMTVASVAKKTLELPENVVDEFNTTLPLTWESDNEAIAIDENGTVTVTPGDKPVAVKLTATATFDENTPLTTQRTVTVFPKSIAGTDYDSETVKGKIGEKNLLADRLNADFSGENWNEGWQVGSSDGPVPMPKDGKFAINTVGDVNYIKATAGGGAATDASLVTVVEDVLTIGKTYVATLLVNDLAADGNATYRRLYNDAVGNSDTSPVAFQGLSAPNGWELKVYPFTAVNPDIKYNLTWLNGTAEFAEFGIYELTAPDSEEFATALSDITIPTVSKGAALDLTETVNVGEVAQTVKWYTSNSAVVADNGAVTKDAKDVKTAVLTPAVAVNGVNVCGTPVTVSVLPEGLGGTEYRTDTDVYTVGDENLFEGASFTDGTTDAPALDESAGFEKKTEGDVVYYTVKGYNDKTSNGSSPQALKTTVSGLEQGSEYLITVTAKDISDGKYIGVKCGENEFANIFPAGEAKGWNKLCAIFTAEADELTLNSRWNNSSYAVSEFELYKLEKQPQNLKELIAPADISVIEGNMPKLPATLEGIGTLGSNYHNVPVTWDEADFKEATTDAITVNGHATDNEEVKTTIKVNVLPCTDETLAGDPIVNISKSGGSTDAAHAFTSVKGKANFEFDVQYAEKPVSDDLIALGNSKTSGGKPSFGSEAVALQGNTDGIGFRTDGDKWTKLANIEVGKTYRVFVSVDLENRTYSGKVYDESGKLILDEADLTYRNANTDEIDTVYVIYNKDDKENKTRTTVSNFRVAWTDKDSYKDVAVEYKDGETSIGRLDLGSVKVGESLAIEAGKAYFNGKIYELPAVTDEITDETGEVIEKQATVKKEYAAKEVAFDAEHSSKDAETKIGDYVGVTGNGVAISEADDNGIQLSPDNADVFGESRAVSVKIAVPTLGDGEAAILNIAVGAIDDNRVGSTNRIRLKAEIDDKVFYTSALLDPSPVNGNRVTSFTPAEYIKADITAAVKAANEVEQDEITVVLKAYKGGVGLVNETQSAFGGINQGNATYIDVVDATVVDVAAPASVELGWNGENFTLDFIFGDVTPAEGDMLKVVAPDGAAAAFAIADTTAEGVSFSTNSTNTGFKGAILKNVDGLYYSGTLTEEPVGIYGLVAAAVKDFAENDEYDGIVADQLAAAVQVLNKGGIYLNKGEDGNYALTKEASELMTLTGNTITLNEKVANLGLKFNDGIVAESSASDTLSVKVAADGKSVEIEGLADASEAVIYLEDVEFVLEADTVEENADETVSGDLDFVEEI